MIAWLNGTVLEKTAPYILLDVQGVGYEIEVPASTLYELPEVGSRAAIYTHLVVREDAQLLFGFSSRSQRDLFRTLIKMNGVGPKVALAVLSTMTVDELVHCAATDDVSALTKVPGIGQKTAQRMLVELKDRIERDLGEVVEQSISADAKINQQSDAISALVALGYKQTEAARVVKQLDPTLESADLIRQALRVLSGKVL
ncbi:MAG: Holliday junction branch migration protein RuvA [Pseudomonadota bacterium]